MFEGMDQVDWASLWACGPATDVPRLLRTLASSTDPEERKAAHEQLAQRVLYQGGSILEVTPYATPYFIELLAVAPAEEHVDMFALLASIARAQPFAIGAGALDKYPGEAAAPPELQAQLATERDWVRRSYEAVEQGVPTYLTFLAHPAAPTRKWAAYLLSLFSRQAPVSIPALRAHLDQEDDLLVRAALVASLGGLLEPGTALPEFISPYLHVETSPLLRCVAAIAYARNARSATPPEVVQILIEMLAARQTVEALYQQMPELYVSDYYTFTTHVCETLAKVGPAQAIPALRMVLDGFRNAAADGEELDDWEVCYVAESLVAAVFSQGEKRSVPQPPVLALTREQRTALKLLMKDDFLCVPLENYGLPPSAEALSALLRP